MEKTIEQRVDIVEKMLGRLHSIKKVVREVFQPILVTGSAKSVLGGTIILEFVAPCRMNIIKAAVRIKELPKRTDGTVVPCELLVTHISDEGVSVSNIQIIEPFMCKEMSRLLAEGDAIQIETSDGYPVSIMVTLCLEAVDDLIVKTTYPGVEDERIFLRVHPEDVARIEKKS